MILTVVCATLIAICVVALIIDGCDPEKHY
jgi:hypothetical protein